MSKIKVIFIASVYRHLTAFHMPYIHYFQSLGYQVYAAGYGEVDKKILEDNNVICFDVSFSRSPINIRNIKAYKQLKKLFKLNKFELVHVHTPVASILSRLAFKKSDYGKLIYTAHGFHFFEGSSKISWLTYYSAEKLAARWTDHLITINNEDFLSAQKIIKKERVSLVHGVGVELPEVYLECNEKKRLKKELGVEENSIIITYIAELNENKNHIFLLKNWNYLKDNFPKIELLLIGTGEKEEELKNIVENEKLKDIHFLGYRRDVQNILQIADISTLLSYREGLPKSIMEAMVHSLPCVVTNTRGLRDLVQNEKNGYVISHGDNESLVRAFSLLINSVDLREKMGQKGKEMISPFMKNKVLNEYIEIYKKVLQRREKE